MRRGWRHVLPPEYEANDMFGNSVVGYIKAHLHNGGVDNGGEWQ